MTSAVSDAATSTPSIEKVDLCVIGAGSGNSLLDDRFAHLSVALVDAGAHFGGTCLTAGCIPTKMMVLPADLATSVSQAAKLGIGLQVTGVDWPAIRDRIFRDRIDQISASGVAYREGQDHISLHRQFGRFVDEHTLELADGHRIVADRFVIAAGSRPRVPDLPGFDDPAVTERVHTSDTIMRLDALPARLAILGGGFVAVEFAHIFSAFGVEVTLVHRGDRLLSHCDGEIRTRFTAALGEQVNLRLNQSLTGLSSSDAGVVVHSVGADGTEYLIEADLVLNATGRIPNGDRLNVEAAGLTLDERGFIVVDDQQRTHVPHIWALGDVSQPAMLKHVANHEMRTVQHNLLVELTGEGEPVASNHRFIPSAVFSEPQIGQVGLTEEQAKASGKPYLVHVQEYGSVAFGWALEDQTSAVKLIADAETRTLIGAHFVGPQAASLVQLCIQAMNAATTIDEQAKGQYWIHPALPEVVENALLALASSEPVHPEVSA